MEDNIALQESKEGAHCNRVEALWVKFVTVAKLKSTTKEKGVSCELVISEDTPGSGLIGRQNGGHRNCWCLRGQPPTINARF
jgi:hypothetical protein